MEAARAPLVSVVTPTRNRADKLARCLDSLLKSDYPNLELVVVDDASDAPASEALLPRFPEVSFVRNPKRMLLAYSRNAGAAVSRGEYLFFLDDDNVVAVDTIRLLAETLGRSERVAVSCPVIYYLSRPNAVWTSYISRSRLPGFYDLHTDVPAGEAPTFSFHNSFMVKKRVFDSLGGFDWQTFPIRFGEVDFAHRVSAARYLAVLNPRARDWHDLGWTTVHIDSVRAYYTERNRIIVLKRYFGKGDLAFYTFCLLPFVGAYYLVHHPLSTSDSRMKTASSFVRGTIDGLRFHPERANPKQVPATQA